jgi:hypothetical protein
VSRLFIIGGLPIAVRVLIADAARNGCGAVLLLSPITRLLGRGDTTRSRRSNSRPSGGSVAPAVSIESRL